MLDPIAIAGDYSSLGLIPFLIYMHLKAEKRQDLAADRAESIRTQHEERIKELSNQWEAQIDEMLAKYDAREERVRDRYDAVVAKLDDEKKHQIDSIKEKIDEMTRFLARPAGR